MSGELAAGGLQYLLVRNGLAPPLRLRTLAAAAQAGLSPDQHLLHLQLAILGEATAGNKEKGEIPYQVA